MTSTKEMKKAVDILSPKERELIKIPGETITLRVIEDKQERVWKEFLFRKGDGIQATRMAKELEKLGHVKIENEKQIVVRIRLGLDDTTFPLLIKNIINEIDKFII